jgi:hypothetical protein
MDGVAFGGRVSDGAVTKSLRQMVAKGSHVTEPEEGDGDGNGDGAVGGKGMKGGGKGASAKGKKRNRSGAGGKGNEKSLQWTPRLSKALVEAVKKYGSMAQNGGIAWVKVEKDTNMPKSLCQSHWKKIKPKDNPPSPKGKPVSTEDLTLSSSDSDASVASDPPPSRRRGKQVALKTTAPIDPNVLILMEEMRQKIDSLSQTTAQLSKQVATRDEEIKVLKLDASKQRNLDVEVVDRDEESGEESQEEVLTKKQKRKRKHNRNRCHIDSSSDSCSDRPCHSSCKQNDKSKTSSKSVDENDLIMLENVNSMHDRNNRLEKENNRLRFLKS